LQPSWEGWDATKKRKEEKMTLTGTQTEKNLMAAFAGESQARNRYTFYAHTARQEGYVQISDIFEETANQERAHAYRLMKFLKDGQVEITASFESGIGGTTEENLRTSAAGESHEDQEMYPGCAQVAREEGFPEIAGVFEAICVAERQHAKRFIQLAENIAAGSVFTRSEKVVWRCRNCGYLHEGHEAPHVCPACAHPQAHFELLGENW
jgi:rubrerythrin